MSPLEAVAATVLVQSRHKHKSRHSRLLGVKIKIHALVQEFKFKLNFNPRVKVTVNKVNKVKVKCSPRTLILVVKTLPILEETPKLVDVILVRVPTLITNRKNFLWVIFKPTAAPHKVMLVQKYLWGVDVLVGCQFLWYMSHQFLFE